jgi:endonuclease III
MRLQTSPYLTRQEEYRDDPWKMLMVCFMLNQTHHRQVDEVREHFFNKCGTAERLIDCPDLEIIEIIKPLGFYNKRVKAWKQFSYEWLELVDKYKNPIYIPTHELIGLKGVGKYAIDSWRIFQCNEYDEVDPDDHVLNFYVEWARAEKERILREQNDAKPMTVYYAHYTNSREEQPNWNRLQDYVCCVMARTQDEAIEKTKRIALKRDGAVHIKIAGIGFGRQEWVDEEKWLETDPEYYHIHTEAMWKRMETRRILENK